MKGEVVDIFLLFFSEEMIFNFREIFEVISVGIVLCEGEEIIENERVYSRVVNLDKWLK